VQLAAIANDAFPGENRKWIDAFKAWLASRAGFVADRSEDEAVGLMSKNERGAWWMSTVTLRPRIAWSGDKLPPPAEIEQLHHRAHEECFIANSIKTEVRIQTP
jgi:organic hydroperoxide reductase OsmC/OhrA